ncbi:Serine hydrolase (FSH1)-like protein [Phytophthora palmivora]|uniref:Serine hydrolase (FSH1)-like protein n=1 Tax=Phytophthora palmivora TaxID=4796 RepID=A0A2P4X0Q5_9STRA|nr:Serine hydrolase (FSH1)-like protein [Phytophthora palmivora]
MESQTQGLRDALGPNADFVFLNGPFEARGPTDEVIERMFGDTAPFYEWWGARSLEKEERDDIEAEEGVPRGTTKRWCLEFDDIDRAIEYMDEKLNDCPGLWRRRRHLVLCVCGVYPQGINVRELFETHEGEQILVPVPSIHVVGQKDSLYKDSLVLKNMYMEHVKGSPLSRLLLEHDGGHKFPTPKRHQKFYADLASTIWQFFEDTRQCSVARL